MQEISFKTIRDEIFSAWREGKTLPFDLEKFDFRRLLDSVKSLPPTIKPDAADSAVVREMSPEAFRDALVNSLDACIRDIICREVYPEIDEEAEREALALNLVRTAAAMLPPPYNSVVTLIEPLLLFLACQAIEFIVREGIEPYCSMESSAATLLFGVGEQDGERAQESQTSP
jgi:hypothetical protein